MHVSLILIWFKKNENEHTSGVNRHFKYSEYTKQIEEFIANGDRQNVKSCGKDKTNYIDTFPIQTEVQSIAT